MRSVFYLLILVFLLASCSTTPFGNAVQTAKVQTEMARPTKTFVFSLTYIPTPIPPTSIPLADLDLESILIQPGDLPAGYTGAQVRNFLPAMFDSIPQPINQIYQQFEQDNGAAGGAAVIVYDTMEDAGKAYDLILEGMGETEKVQDVGEKGNIFSMDLTAMGGITNTELLFLRCSTVVHIRMTGTTNQDYIISYGQRLDGRLAELVCR